MSTIVVFVEHTGAAPKGASLQALGAARRASEDVVAVLCGEGVGDVAGQLGAKGATRAIVLGGDASSPDAVAAAIADVVRSTGAQAFLASATSSGRDVAPRVAAHLDATLFSDCIALEAQGDSFEVRRPWLAGKLVATLRSSAPVLCATLRRNVFAEEEKADSAAVEEGPSIGEGKVKLTGIEAKAGGALDVSDAPVVVSGGRGLKDPSGFGILEELAAAFGNAAVGASRAVVDAGWRPHSEQVGQTGKTVSPQIYVAAGISGAIQHLAGMKTSKVIVAINKDAEAPIFKVADYGIVGDAFEVVPALTEEIKKVKAEA